MPHAVRVLGAWLYGPKVVFPLFVIALICHFQLVDKSALELTFRDFVAIAGGVFCAPVAFEIMKFMRIDVYPKDAGIVSWRTLIFVGFVSSVLNAFLNGIGHITYYKGEDTLETLLRYVVGDVAGLFVVLITLVFATKKYRKN